MAGLFDMDPFAADKAESLAAAQLGTPNIYGYYAGLGGRMLGRGLGMAAMGGDPRIEQAAELQASMQTMDPNDPSSMYRIGQKFLATGDYDRALKFFERGQEMEYYRSKSAADLLGSKGKANLKPYIAEDPSSGTQVNVLFDDRTGTYYDSSTYQPVDVSGKQLYTVTGQPTGGSDKFFVSPAQPGVPMQIAQVTPGKGDQPPTATMLPLAGTERGVSPEARGQWKPRVKEDKKAFGKDVQNAFTQYFSDRTEGVDWDSVFGTRDEEALTGVVDKLVQIHKYTPEEAIAWLQSQNAFQWEGDEFVFRPPANYLDLAPSRTKVTGAQPTPTGRTVAPTGGDVGTGLPNRALKSHEQVNIYPSLKNKPAGTYTLRGGHVFVWDPDAPEGKQLLYKYTGPTK